MLHYPAINGHFINLYCSAPNGPNPLFLFFGGIKLPFGLYITNSVQEEVGLRGAQMIVDTIKPNVEIVFPPPGGDPCMLHTHP